MKSLFAPLGGRIVSLSACGLLLLLPSGLLAQPVISNVNPANGATGVSPSTTVVFTFSEPMNTGATTATFIGSAGFVSTTPTWSVGNTVLTCTPDSAFPANTTINWFVSGLSAGGQSLGGVPVGTFSTTSGGSSGTGTNAITTFSLAKIHSYEQTAAAAPTLSTNLPYAFSATTALASNRTATGVTLTMPTTAVSNLMQSFLQPEEFLLGAFHTNLTTFDATFPSGNYTFFVQSAQSNQSVVVNFPGSLQQPAAPHIANYPAAQSVDATQPFTLTWDTFPGGTAADGIYVEIGNVYSSTNLGTPGALNGTATSFTIPANTLQPNTTYDSWISFHRAVLTTNGNSYVTFVSRVTYTAFTIITTGGASGPLVLTNATMTAPDFSFDVDCTAGQTVTVQYRTDLALGTWQTLFTTNSPDSRFHVVVPQAIVNPKMFFRAKDGI